jgi:type II secretory pathway pseudopilin PulG
MAALLVSMSIVALLMTAVMPVWKQMVQREKEEELVFRGQQYVHAITLYGRKFANTQPPSVDVLVQQRFLRKKYKDPITNDDFQLVLATQAAPRPGVGSQGAGSQQPNTPGGGAGGTATPGPSAATAPQAARGISPIGTPGAGPAGGIMGVTSKSKNKSIRLYNGRTHYNEWVFLYQPQQTAGGAGVGPGVPGQRGVQPVQGPNPFGGAGIGARPGTRPGGSGGGAGQRPPGGPPPPPPGPRPPRD